MSDSLRPHGLLWLHGAHQALLSVGKNVLQAKILEWVAMPSSRGSSQPRDRTHIFYKSCTDRWALYQ